MARRGGGEGGHAGGMTAPLIAVAVSVLIFVILEIFAPTIAGAIQAGQPAQAANSLWNNTYRAQQNLPLIPDGSSDWVTIIRIIAVVYLIVVVAIAIYYMKGMA